MLLVEKECTRCHKKFSASVEIQEVCPACLADEFSAVSAVAPAESGAKRSKELAKRSNSWNKGSSVARASAGRLRCVMALLLFVLCVAFIAVINEMHIAYLPEFNMTHQFIISVSVSIISALLLCSAYRHNKKFVLVCVPVVLAMGGGSPYLFYRVTKPVKEKEVVEVEKQYEKVLHADEARIIEFYKKKEQDKAGEHFCVLVLFEDVESAEEAQQLHRCVAAALRRCLNVSGELSATASVHFEPYAAKNYPDMPAYLYFAYNARKDVVASAGGISKILSSIGRITQNHHDTGVYELVTDAATLKGSDAMRETAAQPDSSDYFKVNFDLLNCADAAVVQDTAERLIATYPQLVAHREEICNRLEELLKYYWNDTPDTHKSLVEAWLTYCDDKESTKVRNTILNLWQHDSARWEDVAATLGPVFETELQNFLNNLSDKSENRELLFNVLDYLQHHGTAQSLILIESYSQSDDEEMKKRALDAKASILLRNEPVK